MPRLWQMPLLAGRPTGKIVPDNRNIRGQKMNHRIDSQRAFRASLIIALFAAQTGCASTYGNLVSGSELGAQEYRPAVFVPPENQAKYDSVLPICRQAATNRQITAAQEAQLKTITGVTEGAGEGLAFGVQFAGQMRSFGFDDVDVGDSAMYGAVAGLLGSLASSFASGAEDSAAATRRALLVCLETASNNGQLWQVLE